MTITVDQSDAAFASSPSASDSGTAASVQRLPGMAVAGLTSVGAGAIHAAAIGIHAEHPQLARIFVVCAVLQLGVGMLALLRPTRLVAVAMVAVNIAAVGGWLATRLGGISWIDGLEAAESPQFADSVCALLGAVAVVTGVAALIAGRHEARPPRLLMPGLAALALTVPAMVSGGTHVHQHDEGVAHDHGAAAMVDPTTGAAVHADDGHPHTDQETAGAGSLGATAANTSSAGATPDAAHADEAHTDGAHTDDGHPHDDGTSAGASAAAGSATAATESSAHPHPADTALAVEDGAAPWPRPWQPGRAIDLGGVEGVTPEQEARAVALVEGSLQELPRFSTVDAAKAAGYTSIGDAGTGSEHYIRYDLVQDDVLLDPTAPESLVYTVDGDQRTLAGAMYIASARPTDDPSLTDWAGPLMQWHNHGDLCWDRVNGANTVVGIVQADGTCARGVNTGGANPMVHVWITPHDCGVFAALEGVGAGQTAVSEAERVDKCRPHDHGAAAVTAEPKPYDPTMPIDLSGTPGVTPQQQAAAENLIAVTLVRLPQWSDYRVAEAAGFHSIGDSLTGHEHFVQWDWINDDVMLDPDHPESLVYEPQPDGSKKLVSAMFMLSDSVALEDVPDIGGGLMQWHIHENLCYTDSEAPRVAGLTDANGNCSAGLIKHNPAPMIHVWITSHPCGPFAALEGVGAGQVAAGQQHLCDTAHGSH